MSIRRCRELCKMSAAELAAFFGSFDVVMTDCDGVLWTGGQEITGEADDWLDGSWHFQVMLTK